MYVRLEDPLLAGELISFLSRCSCSAVQVGRDVLKIDVDHEAYSQAALRLVRAGRCLSCGEEIERPLAEAGSLRCHECRTGNIHQPEAGRPTLHGKAEPAVQLRGYLRVWAALHPETEVTVLDGGSSHAGTASVS
jgi:hypothetical protein